MYGFPPLILKGLANYRTLAVHGVGARNSTDRSSCVDGCDSAVGSVQSGRELQGSCGASFSGAGGFGGNGDEDPDRFRSSSKEVRVPRQILVLAGMLVTKCRLQLLDPAEFPSCRLQIP